LLLFPYAGNKNRAEYGGTSSTSDITFNGSTIYWPTAGTNYGTWSQYSTLHVIAFNVVVAKSFVKVTNISANVDRAGYISAMYIPHLRLTNDAGTLSHADVPTTIAAMERYPYTGSKTARGSMFVGMHHSGANSFAPTEAGIAPFDTDSIPDSMSYYVPNGAFLIVFGGAVGGSSTENTFRVSFTTILSYEPNLAASSNVQSIPVGPRGPINRHLLMPGEANPQFLDFTHKTVKNIIYKGSMNTSATRSNSSTTGGLVGKANTHVNAHTASYPSDADFPDNIY
jgi:hypothetical protein